MKSHLPLCAGDMQWATDEARQTISQYQENIKDMGEAEAWRILERDYLDSRLFGPDGCDPYFLYQRALQEAFPKLAGIK